MAWTLFPILVAAGAQFVLNREAVGAENRNRLISLIIISMVAGLGASALASFGLHQDFFSIGFMLVVQVTSLGLFKIETIIGPSMNQRWRHQFFLFGMVASSLFTLWIMLMGYTLVTRQEPRWWESLIYNFYNTILACFLYYATLRLAQSPARSIVSLADRFIVDDFDLSAILGEVGCLCASRLLREYRLSCFDIMGSSGLSACSECAEPKVSLCAKYRTLYNSVRLVRKCFEALRIGTIKGTDGKEKASSQAWVFVPAAPFSLKD